MSDELARSLQQSVNQKFGIGAYNVLDPIKRGGSGYIYKIYSTQDKRYAVLKTLPRQHLWNDTNATPEQKMKKHKQNKLLDEKGQNQLKIHQSLHSNYVVKLFNSSKDETNYYLFMQYFPRGDLQDQIQRCLTKSQNNNTNSNKMESVMDVARVRKIGLQLAMGIDTIHKKFVIHRDIKPKNVLMGDDDQVKICDFSCSTFTKDKKFPQHHNKNDDGNNDKKQNMKVVGTLQYMAPEALNKGGNSVDIWSYGCVLYCMITGSPPFKLQKSQQTKELVQYLRKVNQRTVEQFVKTLPHNFPSLSSEPVKSSEKPKPNIRTLPLCGCQNQRHSQCLKKLIDLLRKVFVFNPNNRIRIEDIIRHPFFTGEKMMFVTEQQQKLDTIQNYQAQTKREQKQFGTISHNTRNNNFLNIPQPNETQQQSNTATSLATTNRPKPSYSLQNIKKPQNSSHTNSHQSSLHDYHTLEDQNNNNNKNMTKTQAIINRHKQKYTVQTKSSQNGKAISAGNNNNSNNGSHYSSRIVGDINNAHEKNQYKNQRKQATFSNQNVNTLNTKTNNRDNQKYGIDELFKHKLMSRPEHTPLSLTPTLGSNNPKFISDTHPQPHPHSSTLPNSHSSSINNLHPLPFSTQNLNYSLKIAQKQQLITINQQGLKGQFLKSNKAMVISPKGTHVTIIYQDKSKKYQLQRLPQKYVPLYQSYRTIVQQIRKKQDTKRSSRNLYNTIQDQHEREIYRAAKTSRNKDQKQRRKSPQRSSSIAIKNCKQQQTPSYSSSSLISSEKLTPSLTTKFPLNINFPSLKTSEVYMLQITTNQNDTQKKTFIFQLLKDNRSELQKHIKPLMNNKIQINNNQLKLVDLRTVIQSLIQSQIKEQLNNSVKQTIQSNASSIEQYSKLLFKYCQWVSTMPTFQAAQQHNSIPLNENDGKNQKRPYSSSSTNNNSNKISIDGNNYNQMQKEREKKLLRNYQEKGYGYHVNKVESYVQKYR